MIKRELYLSKIRPFMNRPIVKVLTGIRRSGKSVLLQLIREELLHKGIAEQQFLTLNFESRKNVFATNTDSVYAHVTKFADLHSGRIYLFFDEIQELDGWETMINACMVDFDADIYLTGSNATLLSGELATYLAGRYVEIKVYPFSFLEMQDMMPQLSSAEAFQLYLVRGGMPFLYQFSFDQASAMQYLGDLYDSIILKDIAARNKIRDIALLKRILHFFIANIGNTFSAKTISQYLKNESRSVSIETVYNYIEYCRNACFLHLVPREDVIGKNVLQFQEKIYIADHGIREAIHGNNLRDINQTLENIIYMELLRRGYTVHVGKSRDREIDFVAESAKARIYVQVSYILASADTMEREFSVLETIPDNYPKYVVSMDELDRSRNGIKHKHARDFLMMDTYD